VTKVIVTLHTIGDCSIIWFDCFIIHVWYFRWKQDKDYVFGAFDIFIASTLLYKININLESLLIYKV